MATMIVLFTGVWVCGLTLAKIFGSIPSRPMANRMRVWPYRVTRVTEKIECFFFFCGMHRLSVC